MATPPDAAPEAPPQRDGGQFEVHLANFTGPFDVLLSLISKHKLDITEVALASVTDEFIGYIKAVSAAGDRAEAWELGTVSEFLVVAATLLDLKAARLLPSGEVEDAEDLELLEARDLLFARLLQYRAYKQVAGLVGARLADEGRRFPRVVQLEPALASLLPELVWRLTGEDLARLAAQALQPRTAPTVDVGHLHDPAVSVREQAAVIADRLHRAGSQTFRALVADAGPTMVVVARFLALLELFREGVVAFDQAVPLGDLTVRWTGADDWAGDVTDEFEGAS
ncbi:segregation/condensation protein A [Flavimobilis marinus]|uniref:Segregation and condensation protein A n=1 Tax=Flavimobilis marinus TaxID=285351 RepID=A0A1I2F938_9MICO|nr:ScpA family protein [Flavimobilis marinus]GHG52837.1 segregation/condensation protein A [Flavimobilis marinus]SFF01061.1 condensin subunit ScpA [Flavimobilis marinus]